MRKTENTSIIKCDLCGYTVRASPVEWSSIYEVEINGMRADLCSKCETEMHGVIPFLNNLLKISLVFRSVNLERQMKLSGELNGLTGVDIK